LDQNWNFGVFKLCWFFLLNFSKISKKFPLKKNKNSRLFRNLI